MADFQEKLDVDDMDQSLGSKIFAHMKSMAETGSGAISLTNDDGKSEPVIKEAHEFDSHVVSSRDLVPHDLDDRSDLIAESFQEEPHRGQTRDGDVGVRNKRIGGVERERKKRLEAEKFAQDILYDYQALKNQNSLLKEVAQKSEGALKESLLSDLETRAWYLEKMLEDAFEVDDTKLASKITSDLSKLNIEIARQKERREQSTNIPDVGRDISQFSYQADSLDDDLSEEAEQWIEKNPWFKEDAELREEANEFALRLGKRYHLEGRKAEIGSLAFLNEISSHMKDLYGLTSKTQERERERDIGNLGGRVSPVTRSSSSASASSTGSRKVIRLSPEQVMIAKNFYREHPDGRPFSDEEKVAVYRDFLMKEGM